MTHFLKSQNLLNSKLFARVQELLEFRTGQILRSLESLLRFFYFRTSCMSSIALSSFSPGLLSFEQAIKMKVKVDRRAISRSFFIILILG